MEFGFWEKYDETHSVIRFATSWATTMEDTQKLIQILEKINKRKINSQLIQAVSGQWYCLFAALGYFYLAVVLSGNLAYKSKPQTCTAHGAAAGFVHTVEGIKIFPDFRGDTDACVSYLQDCRFCRMNAYSNGTGRPVIFDRIFNQIIDCPVQKDIAACNSTVAICLNKPDLMFSATGSRSQKTSSVSAAREIVSERSTV